MEIDYQNSIWRWSILAAYRWKKCAGNIHVKIEEKITRQEWSVSAQLYICIAVFVSAIVMLESLLELTSTRLKNAPTDKVFRRTKVQTLTAVETLERENIILHV